MTFSISEKKFLINHAEVKHFVHLRSIYKFKTFTMENEKFLTLQGVPIKSSTKIALKMFSQKLSFDGFLLARSIFIKLYDNH